VVTRGRVASLLEVGTGFHPELTGRENIYLNGAILGMSRAEIRARFDEIVDFSEIDKFLDTPVKRYSSGMYVRLAFAVAAHLDADILIVDEVLAVGDQTFQKKCLGKMENISRTGKTVLFVSHNMGAVNTLCTRCIVLGEGKKLFEGSTRDAIKLYLSNSDVFEGVPSAREFRGPMKGEISFGEIRLNGVLIGENTLIDPEQNLVFEVNGTSRREVENFEFQLSVFKDGVQLVTVHDAAVGTALRNGEFRSGFQIPGKTLRPGEYRFGIGGIRKGGGQWLWGANLGGFTIIERWSEDFRETSPGLFNCDSIGTRSQ
jgi:lipopolysaccharide transport system ATP-binding protein